MTAISEERPRFRAAWLALGWILVAAIAVGSLVPSTSLPGFQVSDKLQHLAAYACVAFVFAGALGRARWKRVLLGCLALGAGLEFAQALSDTGRMAEVWDMAANALGAVTGVWLAARVPGGWCRRIEDRLLPTRARG